MTKEALSLTTLSTVVSKERKSQQPTKVDRDLYPTIHATTSSLKQRQLTKRIEGSELEQDIISEELTDFTTLTSLFFEDRGVKIKDIAMKLPISTTPDDLDGDYNGTLTPQEKTFIMAFINARNQYRKAIQTNTEFVFDPTQFTTQEKDREEPP